MKKPKETTNEAGDETTDDSGPDMVIYKKSLPIMILEVKTSVPIDFYKIRPHECIELLIYCLYVMKLHQREAILGSLTDRRTWQVLNLKNER